MAGWIRAMVDLISNQSHQSERTAICFFIQPYIALLHERYSRVPVARRQVLCSSGFRKKRRL